MLEVKNVKKSFGGLQVLKGVSLSVNKGDVVAILGPSGSGKTALLRCMNFLEMADEGQMTFDGEDFSMHSIPAKRTWRGCGKRPPSSFRTTTCSATRPPCRTSPRA